MHSQRGNGYFGGCQESQQQVMVNKQEIKRIQDIELSNDTMCRVLALAEKYALGYNDKYGAYNLSRANNEDLLRLFVREIEIFRLSYEDIFEEYGQYQFPNNLPKIQIINDIKNWASNVSPDNGKKYYDILLQIFNNNFRFSLKNDINKLKEKKNNVFYKEGERAQNLQNHIPYISNNTRELARNAEKNYLYDYNYKNEVKLYQKPDQKLLNQLSKDIHFKEENSSQFYNY